MTQKIMLVDGNSIVNRAFYGLPLLSNSEGVYTNAVYGFLNIMFKLLDEEKPDYMAVAFDLSAPTFRHKMFDGYKGNRKGMPDELRSQMPILKNVLSVMGVKQFAIEGYEADDILGTVSLLAEEKGITPVVISGDRDLLQLCDEKLMVRIPKTKGGKTEVENYLAKDVVEKYGVTPTEFIDLKALMGDTSDNIPGVPGIGEKTAAKIIIEYKNIEEAIKNADKIKPKKASENLAEFAEQARLSKVLATINRYVPMEVDFEETKTFEGINEEAYELFKKYDFKSLLTRFAQTDKKEEKADYGYLSLKTDEEIKALFEKIDKNEPSAYVLYEGGLSFYSEKCGGNLCESKNAFEIFKDYFESDDYKKIGHNVKDDIHFLDKYGVKYGKVYFDTAIAGYILNSTRDTYNYDDIAKDFLERICVSEEELLGKGKSKKSIMDISEGERCHYLCENSEVYFKAFKIMDEKMKENGEDKLYYEIELPLIKVLYDMEVFGIKVNKDELAKYGENLEKNIEILTSDIYELAGEEFNINSPKQLGVILFEKLGLHGGKKTKTGYSTAADILERLANDHPIIKSVLLYRQLAKLKSTYVDGLLAVIDEKTDRIYSTFNQTITATGRISSTEPNLQNIPVRLELGRQLRKIFIPEEDYVFLDADYSQIELRVLADMSGDETLINAFKHNQDIHALTASQVFNVPFEEVTSKQRSDAKAVNFGIVYGIGAFSLSQDLGITKKEADKYIEGYFAKYPRIKEYMTKTISDAKENGYVSTIFGRRRMMPELVSSNFVQRAFGERVAMNMPIQGSAADIIKIAMIRVSEKLKEKNLKSRLILQVHDELLIETHKDEIEIVKNILKEEMENAAQMQVPMDVDVNVGDNWLDAK